MTIYRPAGVMWVPDKARPLLDEIEQATQYYAKKYGIAPNVARVHPAFLPNGEITTPAGVRVLPQRGIGRNYILIGRTEGEAAQ